MMTGRDNACGMAPGEQLNPADSDESLVEEESVRDDVTAFGYLSILLLLPTLAFGAIFSALLDLPGWTVLLLAVPVLLAPRLYALWRLDQSSLRVKIAGVFPSRAARRKWLIIAAVVILAQMLAYVLAPHVLGSAPGW